MVRYLNKMALLAKLEASYGSDAGPTGAANAILASSCSYDIDAEEVERDQLALFMGHQGVVIDDAHVLITCEVEIAGPGSAGEAPAWGPLIRMCGFSENLLENGDIQYRPISRSFEAGTLYYNLDGVNHVSLGTRGNVAIMMRANEIPRFRFAFKGLLGSISNIALPSVIHTAFADPVPVSKANTVFSLHGYAGGTESVSIDVGASIEPRLNLTHQVIDYLDRRASGEATMDAALLSTIDWFAIARAHTTGELLLEHGAEGGHSVKIEAPAVQVGLPRYADSQNIVTQALRLMLKPTAAGNDEVVITVTGVDVPGPGPAPEGFAWAFVTHNNQRVTHLGVPVRALVEV